MSLKASAKYSVLDYKALILAFSALSSYSPAEEDVLDAGCLLDVLRLQRWHISLFEEQVQ